MKIKSVLLRWYKSFNIDYTGYADRGEDASWRPWNNLHPERYSDEIFPFVEVPIEPDITTVVGANESGKSHLLNAIHKVLTGQGAASSKPFGRTDLCLYAAPQSQNTDLWPYIGLVLRASSEEVNQIEDRIPSLKQLPKDGIFALILGPTDDEVAAYLYVADDKTDLNDSQLKDLRTLLPTVRFINSATSISGSIDLENLIAAYDSNGQRITFNSTSYFPPNVTQELARNIEALTLPPSGQNPPKTLAEKLRKFQDTLKDNRQEDDQTVRLELQLFRDLLNIDKQTLEYISELGGSSRSYIESVVTAWNQQIDARLNLSRYWQQDEAFTLQINYKKGVVYFEITDKTGATYTFKDRSSGLRYFLSYYIQAKAIQTHETSEGSIILMDEPDSFLSIAGQRNLMSVFESLVSSNMIEGDCQLIYTTHSPFLINRNFPRRIRLVKKGDAEEGSQFVEESRVRRYEPIRSALGIDCAQTLFMGSTNLVLEGATDQYLLSELIRLFVSRQNASEFLDLNSLILTSAESASAIAKLLASSQWGDELNPTVVVLLDDDQAGLEAKKKITGKLRNDTKLISEKFVRLISDLLDPYEDNHPVVTTEDILPSQLYQEAISRYLDKWHSEISNKPDGDLQEALRDSKFAKEGLAAGARQFFAKFVFQKERAYDKLGVLQEAILIIAESIETGGDSSLINDLRGRVKSLCHALKECIDDAEQEELRRSGTQAVRRIISDFMKIHRTGVEVYDLKRVLRRIGKEADTLGVDSERLKAETGKLQTRVEDMRSAGQDRLSGVQWSNWSAVLQAIRKNPLDPKIGEAPTSAYLETIDQPKSPDPNHEETQTSTESQEDEK